MRRHIWILLALCGGRLLSAQADLNCRPRAVVFAGHTAKSGGATSASGLRETAFNDLMVDAVLAAAGSGIPFEIVAVRTEEEVPLRHRPRKAHDLGADLLVEIHHDSAQASDLAALRAKRASEEDWKPLSGFSVFCASQGSETCVTVGRAIAERLLARNFVPNLYHAREIPGEGRELVDGRLGIYYADFLVVREAKMPAILIECGVISNPFDEAAIGSAERRQAFAEAVVGGIAAARDSICVGRRER